MQDFNWKGRSHREGHVTVPRRAFVRGASAVLAGAALPSTSWGGSFPRARDTVGATLRDAPTLKALAARALDAAVRAGATYVDVRYRMVEREEWVYFRGSGYPNPEATFLTGVGVRALYQGYWGYAALDGLTSPDDMARLGVEATSQAKMGTQGPPRVVDLAPVPPIVDGQWMTPIEIDPFAVSWDEKIDFCDGLTALTSVQPFGASAIVTLQFNRTRQVFASSEGAFYAQTLCTTGGSFGLSVGPDWMTERPGGRDADFVSVAGGGWETILAAPVESHLRHMIAQAEQARRPKPVDIGRYDIVFDAAALAKLVDQQLGAATELDRAMGYTANTVGTSYLSDPLAMLGTHVMGSSLVHLTANRSMPRGAATVGWDDEGVVPDTITLIDQGILTDFQTTRESARWLAPYYAKRDGVVRSHGGATCGYVNRPPEQGPSNLVLAPSAHDVSFDDLVSGVTRGFAVLSGNSYADPQALNAESHGELVYEIVKGKLGRVIGDAVILTRAPEFWKSLTTLGGASTVGAFGLDRSRWWDQSTPHTVSTPAALFTNVAVTTDGRRIP